MRTIKPIIHGDIVSNDTFVWQVTQLRYLPAIEARILQDAKIPFTRLSACTFLRILYLARDCSLDTAASRTHAR